MKLIEAKEDLKKEPKIEPLDIKPSKIGIKEESVEEDASKTRLEALGNLRNLLRRGPT